jgi:hypothetical protein
VTPVDRRAAELHVDDLSGQRGRSVDTAAEVREDDDAESRVRATASATLGTNCVMRGIVVSAFEKQCSFRGYVRPGAVCLAFPMLGFFVLPVWVPRHPERSPVVIPSAVVIPSPGRDPHRSERGPSIGRTAIPRSARNDNPLPGR